MTKQSLLRRLLPVTLVGIALVTGAYILGYRYLFPSPQRTVGQISDLPVGEGRIVEFVEHESQTHADRVVFGKLQFSSSEFASLERTAEQKGYVWLAPDDPNAQTVRDAASEARRALYRLRGSVEDGSFELVVLIPERRQMVIRLAGK